MDNASDQPNDTLSAEQPAASNPDTTPENDERAPSEVPASSDQVEIARLNALVTAQAAEIGELNARFTACQQHYEATIARQRDDYSREKQSTVMRYAQAEKAKLDSDKRGDVLTAKNNDLSKEKDALQVKLAEFKLMNTKLQQAYETKLTELTTMKKELDRIKDLHQSTDATLKSTLNHLKGESAQLREQRELNERLKKELIEQQESNEQLNVQCKQLSETVQAIPTDDERAQALDTLLNEHNALKTKLTNMQDESNALRDKLKSADEDRQALENVIENYRQSTIRDKETTKKLYDDLLAAREHDSAEISRLKQVENLYSQTAADNADLRQLLEKEHQYLELTQKLTEKNSILQTNYEQLQLAHRQVADEHERAKKTNDEQQARIAQLEVAERSLRDQLKELDERWQALSKSHEQTAKQYEDSQIEIQTLKKKHQANTKDLIKQLQQLQKAKSTSNGDGPSPVLLASQSKSIPAKENLGEHSSGRASPTGSCSSSTELTPPVSIATPEQYLPAPSTHHHHHHHQQLLRADEEPEVVVNIVDIDRQKLIDKLLRQQKLLVRRNEKIEFLNDHIQLLTQDLQNKRKIIQSYAMNEESFMYTSPESDAAKQQLASKTRSNSSSLMATLYSRATTGTHAPTTSKPFDQSSPMTLETALDVMGKLQAVLEDTLLKNLTLKENVDTLSKEVERMSKRTRN